MYGGSYGGFMTLMALFTEPKYFGAGAALRPVTDWAHYNHGYTGADPELPGQGHARVPPVVADLLRRGARGSAAHAARHGRHERALRGHRAARAAADRARQDGWSLVPYPVEDHGFVRPDSWTDEYARIFELFETTIRKGVKH